MSAFEVIIQKIKSNGPISFEDFMETALYHPQFGYYNSPTDKIGKHGDYYTSPHCTILFGKMIAKQLEEMWQILGKVPFTIVEYGAGDGLLCRDILYFLKNNQEFYDKLDYCIIEISETMQHLSLPEKVRRINNINQIKNLSGCILSNELVDNFPTHMMIMRDELMEIFVNYSDNFFEMETPACSSLKEYLSALNITLA